MKQLLIKNSGYKILAAVLGYFLSLGICIAAVLAVPYYSHEDFLNDLSEQISDGYAASPDLSAFELHSIGALVYDTSGQCIDEKMPQYFYTDKSVEAIFGRWPRSVLAKVFCGEKATGVTLIPQEKLGVVYVGRPIYQDGTIIGASFIVRDLHDLFPTLLSVCGAYSFVFFSAAVCLVYTSHKKRKYLHLQQSYVSNISHDLKSPITSIRVMTETLKAGLVKDEATCQKYLGIILEESLTLQHIVSDILELSALQSRQTDFSKNAVALVGILAPIIKKYEILCGDKIQLHVSDSLNQLPPVLTNAKSISRLFDILMDNAVKFVEENGEIWVDATETSKSVTVGVRDNGIGIRSSDRSRIFDRFFMGDPSHNANGSGLGLAIAKEIIDGLKEKIWVESTPGKGSAFFFTIQLK